MATTYTRGIQGIENGTVQFYVPVIDSVNKLLAFDDTGKYLPEKSKLVVNGTGKVRTKGEDGAAKSATLNYGKRWCTTSATEVADMLDVANRDNTIRTVRLLSYKSGVNIVMPNAPLDASGRPRSSHFFGNESALLVQLNKSKEAKALAAKYSLDWDIDTTIVVNSTGELVDNALSNALIITQSAFNAAMGFGIFPEIDRSVQLTSRMDNDNPDWLEALDIARKTGSLPERAPRMAATATAVGFRYRD